jgi:hypothetical protein
MQPMKIFLLLGVYIRIVSVINLRVSIYSVFYNILFYYVINSPDCGICLYTY